MTSEIVSSVMGNSLLLDAVDTLFDELNLSFRWLKPALMISVYNSDFIQKEAEFTLAERLQAEGYCPYPLDACNLKFVDFVEIIFEDNPEDKKIYFIKNFDLSIDQRELNLWWSFLYTRDDSHQQPLHLVFWLSESELISIIQKFPDFWENRCRVVDLTDGSLEISENIQDEQAGLCDLSLKPVSGSAPETMTDMFARETSELLTDGVREWREGDYFNACQYLQNAADLADVVQDSPLQVECQKALALAYTSLENYSSAIDAYKKILDLSSENTHAWNNLGNLYCQLGAMPEALEAFQHVIEIDETDPFGWEGLARVYHAYGLTDKAIDGYGRAIDLSPDFVNALEGLGNIFFELTKFEQAVRSYQKVISNDPARISTWLSFAKIYADCERVSDALAILQKAIELNPSEIRLHLEIGKLCLTAGDGLTAVDAFTKALELNPRHGLAYCLLADAHAMAGNISDAINCYELGIDFVDDEQQRAVSWQSLLTLKARQQGRLVQDLTSADAIAGQEVDAVSESQQAEEVSVLDQADRAVSEQQFVTVPRDATYWNETGNLFFAMGNYDQAIQAYLQAIETSPEDFWPYVQNLATAYLSKGKLSVEDRSDAEELLVADPLEHDLELQDSPALVVPVEQEQPTQKPAQPVLIMDSFYTKPIPASKELLSGAASHARHLEVDRIEGPAARHASTAYALPRPMHNTREWATYRKYSDQILPTWTENERTMLLLDAFLEQPRAELIRRRNMNEDSWSAVELATMAAADVNYEKRSNNAVGKPILDAPNHTPNEEDEKWAQAWIRQGNFLMKKSAYEDASTAFSMAINLAPSIGSTYYSLGQAYFHQEKYRDAVSQFTRSIELVKDVKEKTDSWNFLGDAYRRLNEEENALAAYQKAVELSNNGSPLKWRARNLLLRNCR